MSYASNYKDEKRILKFNIAKIYFVKVLGSIFTIVCGADKLFLALDDTQIYLIILNGLILLENLHDTIKKSINKYKTYQRLLFKNIFQEN